MGIVLAVLRVGAPIPIRLLARVYIEFIRGTPLLVVLFIVYFGLPSALPIDLSAYQAAVVGFVLFISAYIAEDFRSGLESVSEGQIEAGLASGLSPAQVMMYIRLPQAVRRMIPVFVNQFIRSTKFTSVASIIGVMELTGSAGIVNARIFAPIETYALVAFVYFVICYSLSLLGRYLYRKMEVIT